VRRARGFTLIEVLVALAIAAIGLAAVLAVITNVTRNATGLRERTFAAWIANNKIVEVRMSGTFPSVDRTTGELEYGGEQWNWEQTVTQTEVPGLRRLDVRVRLKDSPEDAFLGSVSGFVGRTQMNAPPSGQTWDTGGAGPGTGGGTVTQPGTTPGTTPGTAPGETPGTSPGRTPRVPGGSDPGSEP
jgi:general secretion pathway protein I